VYIVAFLQIELILVSLEHSGTPDHPTDITLPLQEKEIKVEQAEERGGREVM
jgi:hypothetical protein